MRIFFSTFAYSFTNAFINAHYMKTSQLIISGLCKLLCGIALGVVGLWCLSCTDHPTYLKRGAGAGGWTTWIYGLQAACPLAPHTRNLVG